MTGVQTCALPISQVGEGVEVEPDWDLAGQPAPDCEVDQRVNWRVTKTAIQTRCGSRLRAWQTESHLAANALANALAIERLRRLKLHRP